MKKVLPGFCFLLCSILSNAQSGAKTTISSLNINYKYPAIIHPFTKDSSYHYNYPAGLTYHTAAETNNYIFTGGSVFNLKGRNLPDVRENNINITVASSGITNLEISNVHQLAIDNGTNHPDLKGWRANLTFNFPFVITISRKGELLKEITFYSNSFKRSFLLENTMANSQTSSVPTVGFGSAIEIESFFKSMVGKKAIEAKIAGETYYKIQELVFHLFGAREDRKEYGFYGSVKTKGREFNYNDIDSLNEQYKAAIKMNNTNNDVARDSLINTAAEGYLKLLQSNDPKVDNNVKDILKYNLAWCNYFKGNNAEARSYFNDYASSKVAKYEVESVRFLSYRLDILDLRKTIAENRISVIDK